MGGFSVDTAALKHLASLFSLIGNDLDVSASGLYLPDAAETGSGEITRALQEFSEHWRWGSQRLQSELEMMAGLLGKAADAYRQSDEAIASAAGPDASATS